MKDLIKPQPMEVVGQQPKTPMELMAIAIQSGADVGTLERIRDLVEWNEKREAKRAYDDALAAFQAECPTLKRTVHGAQGRYKFTPLDHIIEQVKPLMDKHGLSRRFTTEQPSPTVVRVSVIITHRGGHSETSSVDIPVDKRNSLMSDPQQVGGAITFAQRYALQLALGIVTAGDDRDGQGPEPKTNLERLALQPRPAQPEAIDIEEAKPAQPEQQQEPKQAQQPQQPDSAVAELWRLLKPVRGVARNWNQAMEWMRAQGLVGDDVNDIKQLSAKQLASIVSALKNNQPTSTEL